MSATNIPSGDALANKLISVALFAHQQRHPCFSNNLIGSVPSEAESLKKLTKAQSSADYPIVRVTDLSKTAGDRVTVDLFHIMGGKPTAIGDENAEGKGERLSSSSQEIRIDLTSKVADAGGKMAQKRTKHDLKAISAANLKGWFQRFEDQACLVHMMGGRGTQVGREWHVPLQTDPDFDAIMVNAVKAPTYNRHLVASGANLVQGGAQLASIAATDVLTLDHLDYINAMLAESEIGMQPVKIMDDPAAADEPMYVMYVSYAAWLDIQTAAGSVNWRTFLSNAVARASYGSKHPLFKGESGMWGNILVKRLPRNVSWAASENVNIVTSGNRYTGTETVQAVNAGLAATHRVNRCMVLGAQALARVYGDVADDALGGPSASGFRERKYNFDRASEFLGESMNGKAKVRFTYRDHLGNEEPTDHGVLIVDVAAKKLLG